MPQATLRVSKKTEAFLRVSKELATIPKVLKMPEAIPRVSKMLAVIETPLSSCLSQGATRTFSERVFF